MVVSPRLMVFLFTILASHAQFVTVPLVVLIFEKEARFFVRLKKKKKNLLNSYGILFIFQDDIPMTNNLCCHRCSEPIELGTNYVECKAQTYHRECFCCVTCGRPLYGTYYTSDTGDVSCADCA